MSMEPAANTISLPAGWSVVGTRYGSQTSPTGDIVSGYTFIVELPNRSQIQVFVDGRIVRDTQAVRDAIVAEGQAVLAIQNL